MAKDEIPRPHERDPIKMLEKCLVDAMIPMNKMDLFDIELINEPLHNDPTDVHRNTYVLDKIIIYRTSKEGSDTSVLGDFQEDFEGWTAREFGSLDPVVRKSLRDTLRYRGIYTGSYTGGHVDKQLAELLSA